MGREIDIIIANREGDEIFSRFYGTEIHMPAISHHKLKKGEKLSFSYTWDCKDNDSNKVVPEKYTITVKMLPMINYKRNFSPNELTAIKEFVVNGLSEQRGLAEPKNTLLPEPDASVFDTF